MSPRWVTPRNLRKYWPQGRFHPPPLRDVGIINSCRFYKSERGFGQARAGRDCVFTSARPCGDLVATRAKLCDCELTLIYIHFVLEIARKSLKLSRTRLNA